MYLQGALALNRLRLLQGVRMLSDSMGALVSSKHGHSDMSY